MGVAGKPTYKPKNPAGGKKVYSAESRLPSKPKGDASKDGGGSSAQSKGDSGYGRVAKNEGSDSSMTYKFGR